MQIKIKGQAFNRKTNKKTGKPRWESIDTKENKLFCDVKDLADAIKVFENFWNKLNPKSTEIVSVIEIKIDNSVDTKEVDFYHTKDFRANGTIIEEDGKKWKVMSHAIRNVETLERV